MHPENPITIKEACEYLKIHPQTLYKWVRTGKIDKAHRLGRKVLFFKSELHQFVQES